MSSQGNTLCKRFVCSLASSAAPNNFEIGKSTISKRSSVGRPKSYLTFKNIQNCQVHFQNSPTYLCQ
ncbi:hypothetical protein A3Q56_07533 [Intoshia linei]|uniref:Uncharacterized protein n=1 Tax=Intoshia linei TaxID=1819745 RepID=A0A177ARZ8_9BILA|nr:hypothetical protein A3Q56_07533 [Intoshia linei]